MLDKSVAIAALARNCEENLPSNIDRIEKLRLLFSSTAVFVYENNSTDSTKAILSAWQKRSENVFLRSEDLDESRYRTGQKVSRLYGGTSAGRIKKMCDCRNKLLDIIRQSGKEFDYVIFIDIDVAWFSIDGIVESIEKAPKGWGGLFSNCYVTYCKDDEAFILPSHYDSYAYLDCGKTPAQIKKSLLNVFNKLFLSRRVYRNVNKTQFYPCASAFGGIGIYPAGILRSEYELYIPDSWRENNMALCEHIPFNAKVEGEKYISHALEVCYQYVDVAGAKWKFVRHAPFMFHLLGLVKSLL